MPGRRACPAGRARYGRHPDNVAFIDRALADPEALIKSAAPTQPKARAESIGDDVDFHALIVDVMVAAKKFETITAQAEKLDALIAHIDAWAGSRAGKDGGVRYGYAHSGVGDVSCNGANRRFIEAASRRPEDEQARHPE